MTRAVAIYLVKTELEALASEMIAGRLETGSHNLLAYSAVKEPHLAHPESFDIRLSIYSDPQRGALAERKAICTNLEALTQSVRALNENPDDIRIHLPRLSTSKSNYAINYLKKSFPNSSVRICLIPHGLVSIELTPLSTSKKIKLLKRKWHPANLLFPKLNYYAATTDLIGGLDEIVQNIYTFPGISMPFPAHKIIELSGLKDYLQNAPKTRSERTAIVIGQTLLENEFISESAHSIVRDQIRRWLADNNFEKIYYSKHPRAGDRLDFYIDEYSLIDQKGSVEIALCELQPDVVISCYSTALATAKILFADDIRCLSFGLSLAETDKKESLARHFQSIGVELH